MQSPTYYSHSQCIAMKWIGISQLIMGGISIVFGGIIYLLYPMALGEGYKHTYKSYVGSGVCTGAVLIVVGIISIFSGRKNTFTMVTTSLAINLLCSVTCAALLMASDAYTIMTWQECNFCPIPTALHGIRGLQATVLLLSTVQMVISIFAMVLSCESVCRASTPVSAQSNGDSGRIIHPTSTGNSIRQMAMAKV